MATKYTYSIQDDFPNHAVAADRLAQEIRNSAITIALDYASTSGDDCDIWFKASLSGDEETVLDGIVANHSGEPLPSGALSVSIDTTSQQPVPVASIASSGWFPDPSSYPDGSIPSVIDCDGNQEIRGPVLTDEGSFKDDFPGTSLEESLSGTYTFTKNSDVVTGVGTSFRSELTKDKYIRLSSDDTIYSILVWKIESDTSLILDSAYLGDGGTGSAIASKWVKSAANGGSVVVSDSKVSLKSGTSADSNVKVFRAVDTIPLRIATVASMSQRLSTQTAAFGLVDSPIEHDYKDMVAVLFDGTDSSKVKFITACDGTFERTTVDLASGLSTSDEIMYELEVGYFRVSLFVNRVLVATHDRHFPKPYTPLSIAAGVWNTDVSTETTLSFDNFVLVNHNQVQIGSSYMLSEPMPIRIVENSYTLTGKLVTTSTEADQVILSYAIPVGKMLYVTGYSISAANNSVSGDPIKIGRNDLTTVPDAPGEVNGNVLRVFRLSSSAREQEDWSASPRFVGACGDTVKVVVTPNGTLSTEWLATLDFILR